MTEYIRTSVALTPQQKAALESADRSNSEIVRQLVEGWRKHGSVEEVLEEDLESEISALDDEIQAKERRKQQKEEMLERLRDNSLHPDDEQIVEEYLEEKDLETMLHLNPEFPPIKDRSSTTLPPKRFVKEIAKKANSLPIDDLVMHFREKGFDELSVETAPTNQFANEYHSEPDAQLVVELLQIRDEALPDDWEPPKPDLSGLKSVGDS